MDLFLIRHAIAEERRAGLPDPQRVLTERGRARFVSIVAGLGRMGFRFDHVYHSPWRRSAQTAALLAPLNDGGLHAVEGLARAPHPDFFASLEGERVVCIGHEPWMSDAVSLLVTGNPNGSWLRFKKGGVAWLRGAPNPAGMDLRALIPPKGIATDTL